MEAKALREPAVRVLDTHKATDIRVLKVTEVTSLADYFVLAAGNSSTQVRALTDYVDFELGQQGVKPLRTEGYTSASWILMDYGTVVIHVFQPQTRQHYDLERLWQDGTPVDISDIIISEE